ncbi:hypothetical protein [Paraburkholderia sp. SIMBA_054]|uniref:hypothetical protein n=1 Tax=Paraburkholderia sp. SIMBA_054 TaxID=3085795 RepID=UPI00397BBA97
MSDIENLLGLVVELMAANTRRMSALGAQAMVWGKFHEAVLPHLTTLQRIEVTRSFRQCIEDALSMMDDLPLPAEYHAALLELTNAILAALAQEPARRP